MCGTRAQAIAALGLLTSGACNWWSGRSAAPYSARLRLTSYMASPADRRCSTRCGRCRHPPTRRRPSRRRSWGRRWCINGVDFLHSLERISMASRGPSTKLPHYLWK